MKSHAFRALSMGAALALGVGLLNAPAHASSHREAPLISNDPAVDNTDVYAFVHPSNTNSVVLIANYWPFEEPAGGPNFYHFAPDAIYNINVDNVGDAKAHISFQFQFSQNIVNKNTFLYNTGPIASLTDPNFNYRETYTLSVLRTDANGNTTTTVLGQNLPTPPNNIGPRSTPNYEALAQSAVQTLPGGIKVFAGQRDDPFFVDTASIFDLLTLRPLQSYHAVPGNNTTGHDSATGGMNVQSLVLEVPKSFLSSTGAAPTAPGDANAVIGVWATASRARVTVRPAATPPTNGGGYRQVSRLDFPLVNEVVIPLALKDAFNSIDPTQDAVALPVVLDPILPKLYKAIYGIDSPPAPRNDLVTVVLTGIPGLNQPPNVKPASLLRLNMAVPPVAAGTENRLGILANDIAGFPNGRRLMDDVVDIELRVFAGATPFTPDFNKFPNNALTDGVDHNDEAFLDHFPYVGTPWSGYSHPHDHLDPTVGTPPPPPAVAKTPSKVLSAQGQKNNDQ